MFGRPNITGTFGIVFDYGRSGVENANGAFSSYDPMQGIGTIDHGTATADTRTSFNASSSNALYSGSSLQPAAVQTLMIIRV